MTTLISFLRRHISFYLVHWAIRIGGSRTFSRIMPSQLTAWATIQPSINKLYAEDDEQVLEGIRHVVLGPNDNIDLDCSALILFVNKKLSPTVEKEYFELACQSAARGVFQSQETPLGKHMPKQLYAMQKYLGQLKRRYDFNLYFIRFVSAVLFLAMVCFLGITVYKSLWQPGILEGVLSGALSLAAIVTLLLVKPFDRMHEYTIKIEEISWLHLDFMTQMGAMTAIADIKTRAEKAQELCGQLLEKFGKLR